MRILVFGAGSLGCAIGGMLARNHEVMLVGRKENMDAIGRQGLRLTGHVETTVRIETCESVEGLEPPELLVITTKSYHTSPAVEALRSLPWPETFVLTVQNGLGNLEVVRSWKGQKAFGATTTMGAVLLSPGLVQISGLGRMVVGGDLDAAGARKIADAFSKCGFMVDVKEDVVAEIWAKAVVNACINPLTAILRVPNGRLLECEPVLHLITGLCDECVAVAQAAGVRLPAGSMIDRVKAVARETAANRSSMLRDVELGRKTEIAQLNGMICKFGSFHAVPTPLNRAVAAMVEALEPAGT